jgi:ABC-type bacteriocin/lantibiotic exporter with double-glycine peptidase domain
MRTGFALLGFLTMSAGFSALPLTTPFLREHRQWIKTLRAGIRGASFLGDSGIVLQAGGSDCGAACLAMILEDHRIACSLPDLTRRLATTQRGTSMLNLRLVSTRFGIPARSWLLREADLKSVPLPVIAFLRSGHFVVVRRLMAPGVLEVDDPALGRLRWPVISFRKAWRGEALVFDPEWAPLPGFANARCSPTIRINNLP